MQAGLVTKIENGVDRMASVLFAMAAAYAAHAWFALHATQPLLGAETAAIALLAYTLSTRALIAVQPKPRRLPVPVFDVRDIGAIEPPELLLTERIEPELLLTDRFEPPAVAVAEEILVLDDILAELEPNSRVVRMFDPIAMPTPGQLNARIERHLVGDAPPVAPQDASQALHEALAALRRSLR